MRISKTGINTIEIEKCAILTADSLPGREMKEWIGRGLGIKSTRTITTKVGEMKTSMIEIEIPHLNLGAGRAIVINNQMKSIHPSRWLEGQTPVAKEETTTLRILLLR